MSAHERDPRDPREPGDNRSLFEWASAATGLGRPLTPDEAAVFLTGHWQEVQDPKTPLWEGIAEAIEACDVADGERVES